MKKEWSFKIEIKTKRAKILLCIVVSIFILFILWFERSPIGANDLVLNEVKQLGNKLIIDGKFKDKLTRYKSYQTIYYGSGEVVIKIYGSFIGSRRDIHIETKAIDRASIIYLYVPGEIFGKQIWPK